MRDIPAGKRDEAVAYSLERLQRGYDLGIRTIIDVIPWMRANGMEEALIHAMNHENTVRMFA